MKTMRSIFEAIETIQGRLGEVMLEGVWPGQEKVAYEFAGAVKPLKEILETAVSRFASKRVQEKSLSMRAIPKGAEATWEGTISPVGDVVLTASMEERGTRTGSWYWTVQIKIGDGEVESNTFGATVGIGKQGPKWLANKIKDAEFDMKKH